MTRHFVRLLPAAIFLLLFASSAVAQCEDPIIFNADLSDGTVQCPGDLPTECDLTVTASRGVTNCILGEARSAFSSCVGTTAEGTGEDGAIVLFDVNGDPNDDRYFVPTAEGITLTQFENGVAQVTGQVHQTTNPNAILNINMVYDQGVSGDVWDGGFKHAQTCPVTSTITDTWTIYILNSGLSYFTGEGDLDGTLLTLTHAPSSEYFGFQVGEMANDRNCNEGAGGWFSYSGQMNGQTIQGAQGDILLDLSCTSGSVDPCAEDGPSVTLIYTSIDVACGDALTVEQVITRDDTTDPIFDNPPADETVACADGEPAVPTLTASDNCEGDDGVPSVTYQGQSSQYDILCTGSYKVDRTWTATDCSGNTTPYTQTITMVDLVAPVIAGGADYTAECDGAGNIMELEAFLADQGGAAATDDCGTVSWSHDYQEGDLSDGCGATGTVDVIFTASDDCGNESTIELTFTIVDTGAPTLTADAVVEVDCALYDEETIYGASANDLCGDADVVLVSVNEVSSSCAGSYIHTYKAADDCGNESATYDQVVNLIDTEAPVVTITCPADAALLADENCSADTSTDALGTATFTATDNCDDALTLELSHADVQVDGCAGSYTITRTWTIAATDHCGLSSSISCDQLITVSDETNPTIDVAAANETVECDGAGNLAGLDAWLEDNGGAEASDNCTAELTWTNDFDALSDLCGSTGSATVTFTATDDCGNASSTTATFTIEDTTAPSITAENEVDVPCDEYDAETPYGDYAATDGCSAVTTTISDLYFSGSCEGSYQRTYTATDACGNSSEFIQIINLTDEEAPTFTIACPADVTLSADENCGADTSAETHGLATFADVADNCDADVEMTVTYEDATATPCDGSLVITRTFTITGEDNCENITTQSCTQTITVNDDTDPSITAPADVTVECDGMGNQAALDAFLAGATATDNCSDVTIEHDFTALSDDCGATGSATVIFTATDACGNSSSASATFTIEDTTAPSLSIEGPANQDLEQNATCDIDTGVDALGTVTYEAGDDCGSASVEITHADSDALYTCAGDDALLEGSYTFIRTFTVTATDECGLSTSLTYDQTITVTDNLAPVFTDTEGVANGDVQSVCCESHLGEVTIPDAVEPSFTDNCDSDVAYTPTETYVGDYAPTDEVDLFCLSNTPAAFEDGETCNGYDPHSLRIFSLPGGVEFYTAAAPGLVAHNADGTWTLTQSVVAADGSNAGWDITVTYGAALGWDDWSNQAFPTGYKRDCGNLIDDHENWEYRIMEFGSMSGTGDYYGSGLILSHAPSNNYYAFQLGLGANNMNNEYGYSGWFTYSGEFQGNTIMGSGDLFGDLDCCLPWSLEREYTIADDCGNEASFAYSVSVNGDDCEGALDGPAVSGPAAGDHAPVVIGGAGEVMMGKTPIRVTNLQPNPTNDVSQLGFMVDQTMRIRVDLVGMDGALVSELYEGIAQSGVNHTLDIDAGTLTNGMYQIRLSSNAYLVVKKLLVTE